MSELLAPAGSLERAKIALLYGADAVYIGARQYSLRSRASNFSLEDIQELVDFAHERDKKVYVTVNAIPRQYELEGLEEYLKKLDEIGIDAIIVSSPGILSLARSLGVSYELHLSTQHSTLNARSIDFWKKQGVSRIVLGRESSMKDIEALAEQSDLELEVFIHGGMCASYSGRCKLSNYMADRDANRGGCAHSCRWEYELYEDDQLVDSKPLFSMGSRDLNAVRFVPKLADLGIASLKIEGRMKSAFYLAVIVSAYRRLLDALEAGNLDEALLESIEEQLNKAEKRATSDGFFDHIPDQNDHLYNEPAEIETGRYAARVLETGKDFNIIEVHNRFAVGEPLEIIGPDFGPQTITITSLTNEKDEPLELANNPMQILKAKWDGPAAEQAFIKTKTETE